MKALDKEKAARLRTILDLPEASDKEILKAAKGSLLEAQVDLNLSMRQLGRDLAAGLQEWQERWRRFGRALRDLR